MKIAVIGGGSTYSPEFADGIGRKAESLGLTELVLMDIDEERLRIVGGFVRRMLAHRQSPVKVTLETSLERALRGARFVLTQIRVGKQPARLFDEQLGKRHGVVGQETTGVGGFSNAMRTVPAILTIARAIEKVAPQATLINFTNPASIVTEALLLHSRVNTIGLCNIPIGFRMDLAELLGEPPDQVRIEAVGLNHLSFVRGVWVRGTNRLPELLAQATGDRKNRPANIPELDYPPGVLEALGMIPSDYLRYFFLQRETIEEQANKKQLRAEQVMQIEQELLDYYADEANETKPEALSKRGGAFYSHAAIEIIEAVVNDTGAELIVDTLNRGAIRELPDDVVVEVPCVVDAAGARPITQRPLPPQIRGLIQHVKSYEQLTVQAAVEKSRKKALLALLAHPLVPSARMALDVVEELAPRLGLS